MLERQLNLKHGLLCRGLKLINIIAKIKIDIKVYLSIGGLNSI
jgi:hypothetical protein